ncbi:two-component sensor histidine kinase [Pandoraea anapnoica]|uniref:histidine kinase n=1 Tax=Pandoraea anapnoica TaxID=2508301 RepID=A0A5E5A2W8_9BURK|nr:ATP-binding protein [Pandoraea anapnoica]VVE66905.1 two-component sensor histidine kinase [Pandoraea anapnoica]
MIESSSTAPAAPLMHKPSFDSAFYRLLFVMLVMVALTQAGTALLLYTFYSSAAFRAPPGMSTELQLGLAATVQIVPLLFSSWVGARMLSVPFRSLAAGAAELSRNMDAPPIPEAGPIEARQAARVFNSMQAAIRRQVNDRNRFLAAVSHDLRTPLTRMRLRVRTLEGSEFNDRMIADIDEMTQLLDATLSFLRNEAVTEEFSPIDIDALMDAIAEDALESGQRVSVHGAIAPLLAQPLALKRCLTNLVANAIRYGGEARIELIDGDEQVQIDIVDRGPGIPERDLERVLEPFFRLEGSRSRDTGGTGLGLAIANDVVKRHAGSLTLLNAGDGGLIARVVLPRR